MPEKFHNPAENSELSARPPDSLTVPLGAVGLTGAGVAESSSRLIIDQALRPDPPATPHSAGRIRVGKGLKVTPPSPTSSRIQIGAGLRQNTERDSAATGALPEDRASGMDDTGDLEATYTGAMTERNTGEDADSSVQDAPAVPVDSRRAAAASYMGGHAPHDSRHYPVEHVDPHAAYSGGAHREIVG